MLGGTTLPPITSGDVVGAGVSTRIGSAFGPSGGARSTTTGVTTGEGFAAGVVVGPVG